MAWTTVQNTPADPGGMVKPQRCSVCGQIVPMAETTRHDRDEHLDPRFKGVAR